jgi:deoxycytidine triphosphate deaminase
MLTNDEILSRLKTDDLRVTYSFLPNDQDGKYQQLATESSPSEDTRAKKFFEAHLWGCHLSLTLGALVKPRSHQFRFSRSQSFGDSKDLIDLRHCADGWMLPPFQSASMFTNEWVQLPPDVVGLILDSTSLRTNGLATLTSYVDAGCQGLIELQVINTSQAPVPLYLGMELGSLFFVPTQVVKPARVASAHSAGHFGLTWSKIFRDGDDPLPQRPIKRRVNAGELLRRSNNFLKQYAGYTLIPVIIAVLIAGGTAYNHLNRALALEPKLSSVERTTAQLKLESVSSGLINITIPPQDSSASMRIPVPVNADFRGASSFVLTSGPSTGQGVVSGNVGVYASGPLEGRTYIQISVTLVHPAARQTAEVIHWMYVPGTY